MTAPLRAKARVWLLEPHVWAYEVVQDRSLHVASGWSRNWLDALRQALHSRSIYERFPLERSRYESHSWDGDDHCVVCEVTWEDCEGECTT